MRFWQRVPQPERPLNRYELFPLVEILARQFIQRWDMFPQQLSDGRWLTIHKPLHVSLLLDHLRGVRTLGTYLLDGDSQGHFLVFDADDAEAWGWLVCVSRSLYLGGVTSYLETSRRGGHLWLFLPGKFDGRAIRQFGWGLLHAFGIGKGTVELFPKQDELGQGPGSQIRLPFGIHRRSHKRYGFQYPSGRSLAPTLRAQLQVLAQPETIDKRVFDYFQQQGAALVARNKKWSFSKIQRANQDQSKVVQLAEKIKKSISVREFICQYVELSPSGKGLCPFHDDHHPSLNVNDSDNYWYCFACEMGGSIIDFYMRWHDCDFVTAVQALARRFSDAQ